MDDNLYKQMMFEENRKSKAVAYLLWLFTGWFGVHRIYSGNTKSGVTQLVLTLTGVGFVVVFFWWLLDFFLVSGMVNDQNRETLAMLNAPTPGAPDQSGAPRQRREVELDPKREAMLEDLRQTGYRKQRRNDYSRLYR